MSKLCTIFFSISKCIKNRKNTKFRIFKVKLLLMLYQLLHTVTSTCVLVFKFFIPDFHLPRNIRLRLFMS